MSKVVITGMGTVSSMGLNLTETWNNAKRGKSGLRQQSFSIKNAEDISIEMPAGRCELECMHAELRESFGRKFVLSVDRLALLAAMATKEAIDGAGLTDNELLESAAIVYGSASSGLNTIEQVYEPIYRLREPTVHPLSIPRFMNSATPSQLSMLFGIKGPSRALSSACSSSTDAILEGMHMIRSGRVSTAVVGGADASLTVACLGGWNAIGAASKNACRPFSKSRDGTVVGEGAATLILEDKEQAIGRGANVLAEVVAGGCTSDAFHITKSAPKVAAKAVQNALEDSNVLEGTPFLVSAHGTGTRLNDQTEAEMYQSSFPNYLKNSRVFASKGLHGHMLGAAGAFETVLGVKALCEGIIPPVTEHGEYDCEFDIPLVTRSETHELTHLLKVSFAFGGLNTALVLRSFQK